MKRIILVFVMMMSTIPAMAESLESRDIPCQVAAIDRYHRVIARFYGNSNGRHRMCRNALRQCNFEIRRRGWWGVRCVQIRTRW